MINVTPIAAIVPCGIDLRGFSRSPDKLAPAIIPVTAGKNTANTTQKFALSKSPTRFLDSAISDGDNKNAAIDNPMIANNILYPDRENCAAVGYDYQYYPCYYRNCHC